MDSLRRERLSERRLDLVVKTCTACGVEKHISEFSKCKGGRFGVKAICKECQSSYRKEYYLKHRKKEISAALKWKGRNRELFNELHRKWVKANHGKVRKWINEWKRRRWQNDPMYRLHSNISVRIRMSLSGKRGRSWEELVGYSLEDLRKHLESKFTDRMSWDNYGKYWQIDHIRPVSSFKFVSYEDADFKECWRLDNLQPLEASINRRKSNKFSQAIVQSPDITRNKKQGYLSEEVNICL